MHYLTCYRCPLKPGCLYLEHVRAAVKNAPVTFISAQFKCDYKHGHLKPGVHVLVTLPNVAVVDQDLSPWRFHAIVMRWKGRKIQVWLIKPECEWPENLQAKRQVVSVWPDQVVGTVPNCGRAVLCGECRKPINRPVTRGRWNCPACKGETIDTP